MNTVNLIGNICNDVELKTTNNGKSVCSFNLAVKRPFSKDTTDFISIFCWERQAEIVSKYCHKGDSIGITGMLTSRKYQDKDGKNRTVIEIVANNVHFIDSKRSQTASEPATDLNIFTEIEADDDLPF